MTDLLSRNNKNLGNISLFSFLYVVSAFNIVIAADAYPNKEPVQTIPMSTYDVEFDALDFDKSGSISVDESSKDHELARSFSGVDTNNDGEVSKKEYNVYYDNRYRSIAQTRPLMNLYAQDINTSFKNHDKNGDGMLSKQEFSEFTKASADWMSDNSPQGKPSGPDFEVN